MTPHHQSLADSSLTMSVLPMDAVRKLYSKVTKQAPALNDEETKSLLGNAGAAASAALPSSLLSAANKASQAASQAATAAKVATGLEEAQPKTWRDELRDAFTMSFKNRFMGFVLMYGAGWLFMALSTTGIPLIFVKPSKFAVPYTLGSLCSMSATCLLFGPARQVASMCTEDRRWCTIAYLGSMALTLVFALAGTWWSAILCLCFMVVQLCAMIWYVASYIPGGRAMVKSMGARCFQCLPSCLSWCASCSWQCAAMCCCRGG